VNRIQSLQDEKKFSCKITVCSRDAVKGSTSYSYPRKNQPIHHRVQPQVLQSKAVWITKCLLFAWSPQKEGAVGGSGFRVICAIEIRLALITAWCTSNSKSWLSSCFLTRTSTREKVARVQIYFHTKRYPLPHIDTAVTTSCEFASFSDQDKLIRSAKIAASCFLLCHWIYLPTDRNHLS
jgi:hypothetical protein